jgi:hypothetical protein
MKKTCLVALLALSANTTVAAGSYDGIYQFGLSPAYFSVHQNGNSMIVASMAFTPMTDVVFRVGSNQVAPTQIGTWDYASGAISGNKARISGIGLFGACVTTTDITFDASGGATATLVSYANTAFGTQQGVNCPAIYRDAVDAIGGTITLRKIF